jgi:hypothetical protein
MLLQRSCNASWFVRLSILSLLMHAIISMSRIASADEVSEKSSATVGEIVSQTAAPETSEAIEEITVYGDKPLHALRREVYRAEENFFDTFNSINDDDEYDVRCFYEIPSFTHIRRHVCRANFVIEATSKESAPAFSIQVGAFSRPAAFEIDRKRERLRELMEAMIAENPELLQALIEYTDRKQTLEAEKEKR